MIVRDFLSTLETKDISVTLIESDGVTEIITFKAPGFASLEDTLEERTITSWKIGNLLSIKVVLEAETTN